MGSIVLLLLQFVLIFPTTWANDQSNRCIQCDWKDGFCNWRTNSQLNDTVYWLRVRNLYSNEKQGGDVIDSSQRVKNQTARSIVEGLTANDSWVGPGLEVDSSWFNRKSGFLQIFKPEIETDGEVVAWRFIAMSPNASPGQAPTGKRQFYASIWEPIAAVDSTVLRLVGWNKLVELSPDQWVHVNVEQNDRIQVKKGYLIGIHYDAYNETNKMVVPHIESIDRRSRNAEYTFETYSYMMNHSEILSAKALQLYQSYSSKRLPAIRAVVRSIHPKSEFERLGDYFLLAEPIPKLSTTGDPTLISPLMEPSDEKQCLAFKYFLRNGNGNERSKLTVWVVPVNIRGEQGIPLRLEILEFETSSDISTNNVYTVAWSSAWKLALVEIPKQNSQFQLTIKAKPEIYGAIALGELKVSSGPCTTIREVDILSPKGSMGDLENGVLWANGKIPYVIDPDFTAEEVEMILKSMDEFRKKTNCINFTTVYEPMHIRFKKPKEQECSTDAKPICATFVGHQVPQLMEPFGQQPVWLDSRCFYPQGNIIHILAHVVGLWHETNQPNRDYHLDIFNDNVAWDQKHNFVKYPTNFAAYRLDGQFDPKSITHLPWNVFAKDASKPTYQVKPEFPQIIQQSYQLSELDVRKINALYRQFDNCQRSRAQTMTTTQRTPPRPMFFTTNRPDFVEKLPGVPF